MNGFEQRTYRERDQLAESVSQLATVVRVADNSGRDASLERFLYLLNQDSVEYTVDGDTMEVPPVVLADVTSTQIADARITAHFEVKLHNEDNKTAQVEAEQSGGFKIPFGAAHVNFSAKESVAIEHKRSSDMTSTLEVEIGMRETTAPEGQLKLIDRLLSRTLNKEDTSKPDTPSS
jgi:hypothetical protein